MADKSFWDCTISFTDGTTLEIKEVTEVAYDVGDGLEPKVIREDELVTQCIPITATLWIRTHGENFCVNRDSVRYVQFGGPPF